MKLNYLIILLVLISQGNCNEKDIKPENYYNELVSLGLDSQIKFEHVKEYINTEAIDSIGLFNHFSELLDIGFHPNVETEYGNHYRNNWIGHVIHQFKSISKNNVDITLPDFNVDETPNGFEIILNNETVKIEIESHFPKMLGGLSSTIILVNLINSKLNSQNSSFRYIVYETTYQAPVRAKNGWIHILNYRVTLLPNEVIKRLIKNKHLFLLKELELSINKVKSKNKNKWGHNLPYLTDIIDTSQMLDRKNFRTVLRGYPARMSRLINQGEIKYDKAVIEFYSDNTYNKLINTIDFNNPNSDFVKTETCRVILNYKGESFKFETSEEGLVGVQFNNKYVSFLNRYLCETNQNKFITVLHNDDNVSMESAKSTVKYFNEKGIYYTEKLTNIPHLYLLEGGIVDYHYLEILVHASQIEAFYLGYLDIDYQDVKKYCR